MKSVPSLLFFKPMKEEPRIIPFLGIGNLIDAGRAPYRPGEKCYVREAWRPESPIKGTYKGFLGTGYKDGAFKLTGWPSGFEAYPNGKWRSPVTMPQWAARSFVTVLSCEPVRVSEVTVADAERLGVVAEWDSLSANQQENLKEKYMRDAIGEDDLFYLLWHKRHPDKEWAWRIESEGRKIENQDR